MRLRPIIALATIASVSIALIVLAARDPGGPSDAARPRAGDGDQGAVEELEEQLETAEKRLEALAAARAAGTLGATGPLEYERAPGWAGEVLLHLRADDWEPAIAADPNAPYVYILHNRFGGEKACPNSCPDPAMILHVSRNGGKTFGRDRFICECRNVQGQYDPLIEVVPDSGAVYAVFMNDFDIQFSKSLDHGRTWSTPVPIYGHVAWGDKPNMAVSADGQDVYVPFNGPTSGDNYVAVSHDAGETWTQVRTSDTRRYYFAYGGYVGPDGTVTLSEITFSYSGPAQSAEGPIQIHALTSTDGGATWTDRVVDTLELGPECPSEGCYADFWDSGPALAGDADGDLVIIYNGATRPGGPRRVFARSSTDAGATWSDRVRLSRAGANAAYPAAAAVGDDEVRMYYMDQRTSRWNAWYRASTDLGATWTRAVRISDATSGTAYKNRRGFLEVYGDYGEMAITSGGRTVAVWGEGPSYLGPGGVWFNRQT